MDEYDESETLTVNEHNATDADDVAEFIDNSSDATPDADEETGSADPE